MLLSFSDVIPSVIIKPPVLISGRQSLKFHNVAYVIDDLSAIAYQINYQFHCSPFKQALYIHELLAVGFEENFYLFNLSNQDNLLSLSLSGYFGQFYFEEDLIYIADANGLTCVNLKGETIWQNNRLGIDGVKIDGFTKDQIYGSGEFDPPSDWKDFVIRKRDGVIVE